MESYFQYDNFAYIPLQCLHLQIYFLNFENRYHLRFVLKGSGVSVSTWAEGAAVFGTDELRRTFRDSATSEGEKKAEVPSGHLAVKRVRWLQCKAVVNHYAGRALSSSCVRRRKV
jgi:hypothetical protein